MMEDPQSWKVWAPDWRDQAAYPTPDDPGLSKVWRWEFIRRHPDYPADAQRWNLALYDFMRLKNSTRPAFDPLDRRDPEKRIEIDRMLTEHEISLGDPLTGLRRTLANRWGLSVRYMEWHAPSVDFAWRGYHFPNLDMGVIDQTNQFDMTYEQLSASAGHNVLAGMASQVWLSFDLTEHLGKQLQFAKKILEDLRDEAIENGVGGKPFRRARDSTVLLRVLRAYDAVAAGEKRSIVARGLFPKVENEYPEMAGDARVAEDLEVAADLLRSGYLTLRVIDPAGD